MADGLLARMFRGESIRSSAQLLYFGRPYGVSGRQKITSLVGWNDLLRLVTIQIMFIFAWNTSKKGSKDGL